MDPCRFSSALHSVTQAPTLFKGQLYFEDEGGGVGLEEKAV